MRIGSESAFKERCGELAMGLCERPNVDLFGPLTVIVLTGNFTPEHSGVGKLNPIRHPPSSIDAIAPEAEETYVDDGKNQVAVAQGRQGPRLQAHQRAALCNRS